MADDFFGPPTREMRLIPTPIKWTLALVLGSVLFALAFWLGRNSERVYNLTESTPAPGTTVVTPDVETVLP